MILHSKLNYRFVTKPNMFIKNMVISVITFTGEIRNRQ